MAQTPEGKVKKWLYGTKEKPGVIFDFFPGAYVYKPPGNMFGNTGASDCLLCWRGIFVAIEVKAAYADGGRDPTELQLRHLRKVQDAGGIAAVLRGRDTARLAAIRQAVLDKLEQIRNECTPSTV